MSAITKRDDMSIVPYKFGRSKPLPYNYAMMHMIQNIFSLQYDVGIVPYKYTI